MAEQKNIKPKNPKKGNPFSFTWIYMLLVGGLIWMIFMGDPFKAAVPATKVEWEEVKELVLNGEVKEIDFVRNDFEGQITLRQEFLTKYSDKYFNGQVPKKSPHLSFLVSSSFNAEEMFGELNEQLAPEARPKVVITKNDHMFSRVMEWILFPLMLILMWVFMFRGINRGGGASGGVFNVGKAPGKLADKKDNKVTFKDVAGLYGAKEEVMEIVDFLKNPKKYTSLGAKIPKGALLVGPPGTGKTLLAKAVAGEANVPFLSISGSDFVEMFVGVGASRVRDLFKQAKEKAPCIVFIDEIDAVGRARGKNAGFSSNDERENTLNQLLTEMDGFGSNSGVIVMAATNRADILDKALMRAGRFDRQIHVTLPDLNERKEIFQVHIRKLKLDKEFNLEQIAKHTPGMSGADIANVCNEAALGAARKDKKTISNEDFLDAVDRVVGGIERKKTIMSVSEKRLTAYHEAGHALVGWMLPGCDPVLKVSIIPRGEALGLTWHLPDEKVTYSKSEMMDDMCCLVAGRIAEQKANNGVPCSGALSDFERLTRIANNMVVYYGMSEKVGNVSYYDSTGSRGYDLTKPYSEKTAELIDSEIRVIVDEVTERTTKLIEEKWEALEAIAKRLIEKEVIMQEDLKEILGPKAGLHGEERLAPEAAPEKAAEEAAAPEVAVEPVVAEPENEPKPEEESHE